MAKPLRPKRGTTAKNDAFTGLASEITIDTDKHSIRVHDGVTAGGYEILPAKSIDVGVTSVNGQTGDVTSEQTGCLPVDGSGRMQGPFKFPGGAIFLGDGGFLITSDEDATDSGMSSGIAVRSETASEPGSLQFFARRKNGSQSYVKLTPEELLALNGCPLSSIQFGNDVTVSVGASSATASFSFTTPYGYKAIPYNPRSNGWVGHPYISSWTNIGCETWFKSPGYEGCTVTVSLMFVRTFGEGQ